MSIHRHRASLLGLALLLSAGGPAAAAPPAAQVHLSWQGPTPSSMTVTWRSAEPEAQAEYGEGAAYGLSAVARSVPFAGGYLHSAQLSGLKPDTLYHYRLGAPEAWSADRTFRSGPGAAGKFRFAVFGGTQGDAAADGALLKALQARAPAFALHTGGYVKAGAGQAGWDSLLTTLEPLISAAPLMGAYSGVGEQAEAYLAQLALPGEGESRRGAPAEAYYSFDYGNTHFVSLSTAHAPRAGDPQHSWLLADLSVTARKPEIRWVVVFAHRPPYTSLPEAAAQDARQAWCPLLESLGVDVAFFGGVGAYERTKPLHQGNVVEGGGVTYIVTGAAGGDLVKPRRTELMAAGKEARHLVEVNVDGDQLKIEARDLDGKVFDTLSLRQRRPKLKWVLDGRRDDGVLLVARGGRGGELRELWAGFDGRYLYVATEGLPARQDHFIFINREAPPGVGAAPWLKAGQVWDHSQVLAMNAHSGVTSWAGKTILPFGDEWRFTDKPQAPGEDWRKLLFDDSEWKVGYAPVGYGDGDEVSRLPAPQAPPATAYFRKRLTLESVPDMIQVSVIHDDGVGVWVNGVEVLTAYLEKGEEPSAPASAASVEDEITTTALVEGAPFKKGDNIIAVMIKQAPPAAGVPPDLSFDLELRHGADTTLAGTWVASQAGRVMEGIVDLKDANGLIPTTVFLAAAAYGPGVGGALKQQLPAGNGNVDLEVKEWIQANLSGAACARSTDCVSTFCVDGVCCDTACGGSDTSDCQVCSAGLGATQSGTCSLLPAERVCREPAGECDVVEKCDGKSPACPADAFKPATEVCRAATGDCDEAEKCPGAGATCPADSAKPSGQVCRAVAGDCDLPEACDGSRTECPEDRYKSVQVTCRPAAGRSARTRPPRSSS